MTKHASTFPSNRTSWMVLTAAASMSACAQGCAQGENESLVPGDVSEDVAALYANLERHGYLAEIDHRGLDGRVYGALAEGADASVYDERVEAGVRLYQRVAGIAETGVVDADTRSALDMPRCDVPDFAPEEDASSEFALLYAGTSIWEKRDLSYCFANLSDDIGDVEIKEVAASTMQQWSEATGLAIQETSDIEHCDLRIEWTPIEGNIVGKAYPPRRQGNGYSAKSGNILLNSHCTWTTVDGLGDGSTLCNFSHTLLHEAGHALGFDHEIEASDSVMRPVHNAVATTLSESDRSNAARHYQAVIDGELSSFVDGRDQGSQLAQGSTGCQVGGDAQQSASFFGAMAVGLLGLLRRRSANARAA